MYDKNATSKDFPKNAASFYTSEEMRILIKETSEENTKLKKKLRRVARALKEKDADYIKKFLKIFS